ncbi:MAG: DUF3784 domain-containing protein [Eubacteriales bacterium]|nr:DUF3784 domain-containing protein [Eubacteriales bacterium]
MFLFVLILMLIVGSVFLFLGLRIWKNEQITLIHRYHYTKVSEKDKKPYTEKMGKAIILMGIGIMLTGIVEFATQTGYGWLFFVIGFIWGIVMIIQAQRKYNNGLL